MAGCVCIRKAHSFLGQLIDVWRIVEQAPKAADVAPTEIVNEKENDVGSKLCGNSTEAEQ